MLARVGPLLRLTIFRRLDQWWLQRAPMLWRTRLVTALLTLIVFISLRLPLYSQAVTYIENPRDVRGIQLSIDLWPMYVLGSAIAIGLWVLTILRRPVGELPLRRHIATLLAVAIGSYIWLVAPSVMAFGEIRAIANVELSADAINRDLNVLSLYRNWECVPEGEGEAELEQLNRVYARYSYPLPKGIQLTESLSSQECGEDSDSSDYLRAGYLATGYTRERITAIQDARRFLDEPQADNQFSNIRSSTYWFVLVAFVVGGLTVLLSYPAYVWRRILLRH